MGRLANGTHGSTGPSCRSGRGRAANGIAIRPTAASSQASEPTETSTSGTSRHASHGADRGRSRTRRCRVQQRWKDRRGSRRGRGDSAVELKSHSLIRQVSQPGAVRAISLSPDGKWLATAGIDNLVRVFPLHGGGPHLTAPLGGGERCGIQRRQQAPRDCRRRSAGARLAGWHVEADDDVYRPAAAINSVAFSNDGKLLVTASLDHDARIWDVATGKTLRVLEGHAGSVSSAAFSADGRWVVTAGPQTPASGPRTSPTSTMTGSSSSRTATCNSTQSPLSRRRRAGCATGAADGSIATYDCALCARTPSCATSQSSASHSSAPPDLARSRASRVSARPRAISLIVSASPNRRPDNTEVAYDQNARTGQARACAHQDDTHIAAMSRKELT